jgi:hypothetical protein
MKHLKMIALAAMALMAFAGSASATVIKSGTTTLGTGTEIKASVAAGGTARLTTTEGTVLNECTESTLVGKTSNTGGAAETVKGTVAAGALNWSGCNSTVDTLEGGELEIHHVAGTTNGTLTAKGFTITVTGPFGSCVFTAGAGTDMGTLTGSTTGNATMDVNAVVTKTSGLCPNSARWVARYTVTSPTKLNVEAS